MDYFTPPTIAVNLFSGVATDADGESRVIVAMNADDVVLRGDWPRGTDWHGIADGVAKAINDGIPREKGK